MFDRSPEVIILNLDAEQGEHWQRLFHELAQIKELLMSVSPQVQAALDGITQTISLEQSVVAGLALQATQISTLDAKISDLQAQLAAGGGLSSDDLTALASLSTSISTVNTALQSAIPANAAPAAAPAPAVDGSKPQPLPGTGQVAAPAPAPAEPVPTPSDETNQEPASVPPADAPPIAPAP